MVVVYGFRQSIARGVKVSKQREESQLGEKKVADDRGGRQGRSSNAGPIYIRIMLRGLVGRRKIKRSCKNHATKY
jgi:hypothetical protein